MTQLSNCFFELHQQPKPLVLLNAWDVTSAVLFERAGAPAIATSSAAIAASLGYPDGEQLPFATLLHTVSAMCRHLKVPLSVDFEAGYAKDTAAMLALVGQLLAAGAVGINIEDRFPDNPNQLLTLSQHTARIHAIKQQYQHAVFVNARTDVYWARHIEIADREAEALRRLSAYQQAGADGVFVPGLTDMDTLARLASQLSCPINILAAAHFDLTAAAQLGIRRISVGSLPLRFVLTQLMTLGQSVLHGDFNLFDGVLTYDELMLLVK